MNKFKKYKIVFTSDLRSDKVNIKEIASRRRVGNELEKISKNKWKQLVIKAKSDGKKLWESEVYRFETVKFSGGNLNFTVSTIPFSVRLGMNSFTDRVKKLGLDFASLGLFSSCFVLTKDKKYLFIEKSDKYYTNRKYSFIGGVISKSERVLKNGQDLFGVVAKEIVEESTISPSKIRNLRLRDGYITENYNFCLLFEAELKVTFKELKESFSKKKIDEALNIIGIGRKELPDFIKKLPDKDLPKFEILNLGGTEA